MTQIIYNSPFLVLPSEIPYSERGNASKDYRCGHVHLNLRINLVIEVDDGVCVSRRIQNVINKHQFVLKDGRFGKLQRNWLQDLFMMLVDIYSSTHFLNTPFNLDLILINQL